MGKSAQIFLHTWLPDAMEGPTPVSALIHAATMVTAGVYLLARMFPFYQSIASEALDIVMLFGVITLLTAGLIAVVQDDLKKVLAYSSQSARLHGGRNWIRSIYCCPFSPLDTCLL